jgi:hypothetical protein
MLAMQLDFSVLIASIKNLILYVTTYLEFVLIVSN